MFVHLHATGGEGDADVAQRLDALAEAGHPVIAFPFEEPLDLGALFFHFELAVAVAGAVIGINPFDQPDVQSAKDLTVATIEAYVRDGSVPRRGRTRAERRRGGRARCASCSTRRPARARTSRRWPTSRPTPRSTRR